MDILIKRLELGRTKPFPSKLRQGVLLCKCKGDMLSHPPEQVVQVHWVYSMHNSMPACILLNIIPHTQCSFLHGATFWGQPNVIFSPVSSYVLKTIVVA
jgi:hypothetical protein